MSNEARPGPQRSPFGSTRAERKTDDELSEAQPTGGAGGSGNAKVQVVTILGDASRPGPYA